MQTTRVQTTIAPNTATQGARPQAASKPDEPGNEEPVNTLRLRGQHLAKLHTIMDSGGAKDHHARGHMRLPFRPESVRMDLYPAAGNTTSLWYACRNLSTTGVGLLHNAFVHPGTRCTVYLPRNGAAPVSVAGKVARCAHYHGVVHQIGVRFDAALDLKQFTAVDAYDGVFALENVDVQRLRGTILCVDDSQLDRSLVRHFLKDTALNIIGAETIEAATRRATEPVDLILCDMNMPGANGLEFCRGLRERGFAAPIVVMSADADDATRTAVRASGASAFLGKPFDRQKLLSALAEFMLSASGDGQGSGPLHSSLSPDDPAFGFVAEFVAELHQIGGKLSETIAGNDMEGTVRLCSSVMSAGKPLGFEPIGLAARSALDSLNATGSVAESVGAVRSLIFECGRARAGSGRDAR